MNNRAVDLVGRLEIFVRAADAGRFARAAASLHITPSAVSRAVAELERELNVPLFYRTTRHVRVTENGEQLYRRAREILAHVAAVRAAMTATRGRLTGTLRVGISVNVNRYIIMPRLAAFLRRHPALRVECVAVSEAKELHTEGLDVLVRVGDPPDSDLIARKMAQLRFGLYAAPRYIETAGAPKVPEDLRRHRCVVHRPPNFPRPLDTWVFERGRMRATVKVSPVLLTNDREALIAAVVDGAGIMRIGMFDPALVTSGRVRRLLPEWSCPGGQTIYAMYRRTAQLPAKIAAFLSLAEEGFAAFDPEERTLLHRAGA
jgi:DNA-binding transcriptional LysR family regulator